jgi:hypothetical protein
MENERVYITKLDGDDFDWVLADLKHLDRLPARLKAEDRMLSEALRARDAVEEDFRNSRKADLSAEFVHKVAEFDQYINKTIQDNMVIFRRIASIVDRNYDGQGLFDEKNPFGSVNNELYERAFNRIPPTYVDAALLEFACAGINHMAFAHGITEKPADLAMRRQDWKAINSLLEKIQPILDSLDGITEILERQQEARTERMIATGQFRAPPDITTMIPMPPAAPQDETQAPAAPSYKSPTQPTYRDSQSLPKPRKPEPRPATVPEPVSYRSSEPQPHQPTTEEPTFTPPRLPEPQKTRQPIPADGPSYRYRLSRDHLIAQELSKRVASGQVTASDPETAATAPAPQMPQTDMEKSPLRVAPRKIATGRVPKVDEVKLVNDLVSLFKNQPGN